MLNVLKKYESLQAIQEELQLITHPRYPKHPLLSKMQIYVERLNQPRIDTADDASRKRGLPSEPTDGLDNAKRVRLDATTPPLLRIPPLPPGPTNYAQLFTLTQDLGLSSFDVKQLPPDLVVRIAVPLLAQVHPATLAQAVDVSP